MKTVESNITSLILKAERLQREARASARSWEFFLTVSACFKRAEMGDDRFRLTPEYAEAMTASAAAMERAKCLLQKSARAEKKARARIGAERAKCGLTPDFAVWLTQVSHSGQFIRPLKGGGWIEVAFIQNDLD